MANECTLLREYTIPISFTVADGTGIEKGTIVVLSDPATCAKSAGDTAQLIAGITATEKIASDGITKLAVYRNGEFKGYASGSITVGDPLQYSLGSTYPNFLSTAVNTAGLSGAKIVGWSLETCTNGETFRFRLEPSVGAGA